MKFSDLRWLLLIIVLVVVARAAFFFTAVPYSPEAKNRDYYLMIARNVVNDEGFSVFGEPTLIRGPMPVYFFVTVLWLFGDHTLSIAFANWILDAVTAVLLYFIAFEIFHDRRLALMSSLLFAFYGPGIFYSWQALSEPLFGLILAAFVLSFLRTLRLPSTWGFAITGVLLGLTSLTRPIMQYYLPIAIVVTLAWLLRTRGRETIKWAAIFSLSFIVVITPWTIRNYMISGKFIPVSSHLGLPMYQSNYALGDPDFLRPHPHYEGNSAFKELLQERFGPAYQELTQPERDRIAKEEAIKIIRQHSGRYLILSTVRFFGIWYILYDGAPMETFLVLLINGSLLALATIAFIFFRGQWLPQAILLIILLLYYIGGYSVTITSVRFSVPIAPYVMLFAAVSIVSLWDRTKHFWPDKLVRFRQFTGAILLC
jgi:4-amino-4-deoxy-L-arabinose transferase-like glycosyltransferase